VAGIPPPVSTLRLADASVSPSTEAPSIMLRRKLLEESDPIAMLGLAACYEVANVEPRPSTKY